MPVLEHENNKLKLAVSQDFTANLEKEAIKKNLAETL